MMESPKQEERITAKKLFLMIQRQAGVSRRKAQELVAGGEVRLDGQLVDDPFLVVDPSSVKTLSLRGHPLSLAAPELRIYRYHKPKGMLCSHDDPHEGNTVGRVLRAEGLIGYSWAGRLDLDAEGLLLVTNDGVLLNQLSHPRYEVQKAYRVWLDRFPQRGKIERMLREMSAGIEDDGDLLRIASGSIAGNPPHILLRLTEGRKREIKRLFAHFGLEVVRLLRIAIGPIDLSGLAIGAMERLDDVAGNALRDSIREPSRPK